MKTKTVRVVIEREYEISIPDSLLTSEAIEEFSDYMFHVNNEDDIFKYIAEQVFENEDTHVDGIGYAKWKETSNKINPQDVLYEQTYNDVDSEIVGE